MQNPLVIRGDPVSNSKTSKPKNASDESSRVLDSAHHSSEQRTPRIHLTQAAPGPFATPDFDEHLQANRVSYLRRKEVSTVQINLGKRCNQACHHCHVEAGPNRTETMDRSTINKVLDLIAATRSVETVDITGGAPELNPGFRHLVAAARSLGKAVIDRCNLTVLSEPGQEDTARFLADQQVHITASLPCYTQKTVDKQRGKGVFDRSIKALRELNRLGYGTGGALQLSLVYNPGGAFLPPAQRELQSHYKRELSQAFGVTFDNLLTITNMPIKRFAHSLLRDGQLEAYMDLLVNHFNPRTVGGLMCRGTVSVGYDGKLYDCDFNQMLELQMPALTSHQWQMPNPTKTRPPELPTVPGSAQGASTRSVFDLETFSVLEGQGIATGTHCFGCTAGSGSSCGGALS